MSRVGMWRSARSVSAPTQSACQSSSAQTRLELGRRRPSRVPALLVPHPNTPAVPGGRRKCGAVVGDVDAVRCGDMRAVLQHRCGLDPGLSRPGNPPLLSTGVDNKAQTVPLLGTPAPAALEPPRQQRLGLVKSERLRAPLDAQVDRPQSGLGGAVVVDSHTVLRWCVTATEEADQR